MHKNKTKNEAEMQKCIKNIDYCAKLHKMSSCKRKTAYTTRKNCRSNSPREWLQHLPFSLNLQDYHEMNL